MNAKAISGTATTATELKDGIKAAVEAAGVNPDAMDAPAKPARKPRSKGIEPTMREVTVDGQTVKVAIGLSDEDAEKYARKLIAANSPEPEAAPAPAKPKRTPAAPKVADGMVAMRLSKTAYELVIAGDAGKDFRKEHASAWKVLKAAKARSVGSSIAYFASVTPEDASAVAKHLATVAKAWGKPGADRPGNPAPLVRNAAVIVAQVKAAK